MGQYGRAAVRAAEMLEQSKSPDPEAAWRRAIAHETTSAESRKKPCPRGAFLGLCGCGVVRGVEAQPQYVPSKNGEYALRMLEAIRTDSDITSDRKRLWRIAVGHPGKHENGQVDVVTTMWNEGRIE